jgi:ectoine hydroxylase-related dioxygenase (phytanoyl-CoA dioxygenase family)
MRVAIARGRFHAGDELVRRARVDGFLYLPRLLPPGRLDALRSLIDQALLQRGWRVNGRSDPALRLGRWDDVRWLEFLGEVVASAAYRTLAVAPEILAVIEVLVGGRPRLHVGDVCRLVSPGAIDLTTPPHQDAAYLEGADRLWTVWLPLEPCPLPLGPLALLPGSHTGGLLAHPPFTPGGPLVGVDVPDDAPWRTASLDVGDAIFFSSLTVHKALPNVTPDRLRISVDYRYCRAAERRRRRQPAKKRSRNARTSGR